MRRAILARHGESEFSVGGRTNGDPAVACGLTRLGREQARRLGSALTEEEIDLCVTSRFERAVATADLALDGREVQRLVLRELNDIRVGSFEGGALEDYRAWARTHGPEELAPGGGESRTEAVRRYVDAFRTILARDEHTILVVAHGLPVRYVVDAGAGRPPAPVIEVVPYAQPFVLGARELEAAVDRLETWLTRPAWAS
jgi:probable phosphoglycerate mutase